MTSFDGIRVIAVGLNGIVLTSSNAGKGQIVQIIDVVACRFRDVSLSAYQQCWLPWIFSWRILTIIGETWSSQTLGTVVSSTESQGLRCISSFSNSYAMTAGKTLLSFFFLFCSIFYHAWFWLSILCLCKITSPSDGMYHCYRHVTRYGLYYLLCNFWTNILLCTRILGTSSLLYKTTDGGTNWISVSRGLPPAQDSYAFTFHAISVGTYAHVHNVDIEIR